MGEDGLRGDDVKVEFFGGPWDGDRKLVGHSQHEYLIPKPIAGSTAICADDELPVSVPLVVHVYEKQAWKSNTSGAVQLRMIYKGERER